MSITPCGDQTQLSSGCRSRGVIDMHRPERWGVVVFAERADARVPEEVLNEIKVHDRLMEVYYRQRAFKQATGKWARSLDDVKLDGSDIDLFLEEGTWAAGTASNGRLYFIRADSWMYSAPDNESRPSSRPAIRP